MKREHSSSTCYVVGGPSFDMASSMSRRPALMSVVLMARRSSWS